MTLDTLALSFVKPKINVRGSLPWYMTLDGAHVKLCHLLQAHIISIKVDLSKIANLTKTFSPINYDISIMFVEICVFKNILLIIQLTINTIFVGVLSKQCDELNLF